METTTRTAAAVAAGMDRIAEYLAVDPDELDTVEVAPDDPADERIIVRYEGVPAFVATLDERYADVGPSLSDADPLLGELRFYTTDALHAIVADINEWVDGSAEYGPRDMSPADARELAAIGDELVRRKA